MLIRDDTGMPLTGQDVFGEGDGGEYFVGREGKVERWLTGSGKHIRDLMCLGNSE